MTIAVGQTVKLESELFDIGANNNSKFYKGYLSAATSGNIGQLTVELEQYDASDSYLGVATVGSIAATGTTFTEYSFDIDATDMGSAVRGKLVITAGSLGLATDIYVDRAEVGRAHHALDIAIDNSGVGYNDNTYTLANVEYALQNLSIISRGFESESVGTTRTVDLSKAISEQEYGSTTAMTLAATNLDAGKRTDVLIVNTSGSNTFNINYNASWHHVSTMPTSLGPGEVANIRLLCTGTTQSGIYLVGGDVG
jgi:hypothetical protein